MSHFTVLVIGDDIEKELSPYQENNCGNCPKEFMVFNNVEEEYRNEYENGTRKSFYCSSNSSWGQEISQKNHEILKSKKIDDYVTLTIDKTKGMGNYFQKDRYYSCAYNEGKKPSDDEYVLIKVISVLESTHPDENICFEGKIKVQLVEQSKEIPLKEYYEDFEEFIKEWAGYEEKDPETGKYGYWENPNRKWDWYQLGGRWQGMLQIKEDRDSGTRGTKSLLDEDKVLRGCDSALIEDIDFEKMLETTRIERASNYDKAMSELKEGKYKEDMLDMIYGISKGQTKEDYIEEGSGFSTFAVLKDGKWYERGEMGWWGVVSNENDDWDIQFKELLDSLEDGTRISVVDCHI